MSKPGERDRRIPWAGLVDDHEDDAQPARQCATCGAVAPAEPSSHSLISAKYGWRLHRLPQEHGALKMEWVCPRCWTTRRTRSPSIEPQPPSSHEREKAEVARRSPPGMPVHVAQVLTDLRSTGAFEMLSSTCKSLTTKLRSRAKPGPAVNRLLRALSEIESEIATWSEQSGTPERRTEVWSELRALNQEAEEQISSQR